MNDRARARRTALAGGALLAVLLSGCAAGLGGDPLADLHPQFWLESGVVELVTCRWPDGAEIPFSLEGDPSDEEQRIVARAVEAWGGAGLPLRFRVATPAEAQLHIRLGSQVVRSGGRPAGGRTVAECLRSPDGRFALVRADVLLARELGPDWKGAIRPATPDELAGSLVHELGHALGYQGHPPSGGVMALESDALRRLGRRVLAGEAIDAPQLRALYRLPSGSVRARVRVEPWRTQPVDELAARAPQDGARGPFLRVGDAGAAIYWLAPGQPLRGVRVANFAEALRDPARVLVLPLRPPPAAPPASATPSPADPGHAPLRPAPRRAPGRLRISPPG